MHPEITAKMIEAGLRAFQQKYKKSPRDRVIKIFIEMCSAMGADSDSEIEAEDWRIIAEFPNYEVSSLGRVRRSTPFIQLHWHTKRPYIRFPAKQLMASTVGALGYHSVNLTAPDGRKQCKKVSILVCEAFNGSRPSISHQVAHNDGQKNNNRSTNLRRATCRENSLDKHLHGTMPLGINHHNSKVTEDDVRTIRLSPLSSRKLAKQYGLAYRTIDQMRLRLTWAWVD